MLRDDIIPKHEFDKKFKMIQENVHLIQEAIDNPQKTEELEKSLGIVKEQPKEVILISEMSKNNPLEEQKKLERQAKSMVRKFNEDRRKREEKQKEKENAEKERMEQEALELQLEKKE